MASQKFDVTSLPLSTSVKDAIGRLPPDQKIPSWKIVSEILRYHPEYARDIGGRISSESGPSGTDLRTIDEWFASLKELFDLKLVRENVKWISGRLTIWGLAQLDPGLKSYLDSSRFLEVLEAEYQLGKEISPSKLTKQSATGTSEVRTRIERVQKINDESSRVRAYIELLPDVQDQVLRDQVTFAVLEDVTKIGDPSSRVRLLSQLLPQLPEEMRRDVASNTLKYVWEIADNSSRQEAFDAISPYLTEQEQKLGVMIPGPRTLSRQKAPSVFFPPIAGYISDRADQELKDLLDIDREVANIANVLTFKQVQPPLALGLFGDWGSGKTFFMGKLRKYVGQISRHYQNEEQESETEAMWCSRVAQIDFNAWHFSDSNLWASLVTRIYEGLDRELNKEKETADEIKRKIIEAQIKEAKEKSFQAESQLGLAKTRLNSAEENLKQKSKEREQKENTLLGLLRSVPDLLKDTTLQKPLQEAATALGMPEAAKTYEALEELNEELKSVSGRLTAVTASILHSPWTLLGMAAFVVILPVAFTFAIESWGVWLTEAGKRVAEVSTFLLFIVGWLRSQVRLGLGFVKVAEDALKQARKSRQTKIDTDQGVKEAREALTQARAEEQAARTNLELAQTELQRLQLELQELRPERKLQRLIETRANTGAYAQHLGIISLIRSDFESMSHILAEMIDQRQNFKDAPPIQRIILYIDDLDRCKPERVVEVLEAIHLLLFFPLFVVVVAVDPRWLRHSLTQHYPHTLDEKGGARPFNGSPGLSLYSTPQDYLEKIFQIPFALRPVAKEGYQSLVDDLLQPLPAREQRKETESQVPPVGSGSEEKLPTGGDQQPQGKGAQNIGTEKPVSGIDEPAEQKQTFTQTTFTPIPPRQLEFTKWEREDIQRLWLMFRTPRTVKRFINIYRLLRAGLVSEKDVKSFEGTKSRPGEYQVALLLLAAITAFPNEANQLLYQLDTWLDVQELNSTTNWQEVVGLLKQEANISTRRAPANLKEKAQKITKNGSKTARSTSKVSNVEQADDANEMESSWRLMLGCLDQITQEEPWNKPFKVKVLRFWLTRVARFSFSVQPA